MFLRNESRRVGLHATGDVAIASKIQFSWRGRIEYRFANKCERIVRPAPVFALK